MVNATLLVVLAVVAIVVVAGAYEYEQSDSISMGDARLWEREKRRILPGQPQKQSLYAGLGATRKSCVNRAHALVKGGHAVGALDYGAKDHACHIYRPMKPGEYKLAHSPHYTAWTPWQ